MRGGESVIRVLLVGDGLPALAGGLFHAGKIVPSGPGCDFAGAVYAVQQQLPDVVVVDMTRTEARKSLYRSAT